MSTALSEQLALFDLGVDVARLRRTCEVFMSADKAPNTRRNYLHCWKVFERWCSSAGRCPMPASVETLSLFCAAQLDSGLSVSTVRVRAAAVSERHMQHQRASPYQDSVKLLLSNATRFLRQRPGAKHAVTADHVRSVAALAGLTRAIDVRDRSMFLVLFSLGWRRSELASLLLSDVTVVRDRVTVRLGASKADQQGKGRVAILPAVAGRRVCPVRALNEWIEIRGRWVGPLFCSCSTDGRTVEGARLSGDAVNTSIKRVLSRVGVENIDSFAAHSLRAGMATVSAENGADAVSIMQRGGWRSLDTVLGYIRPAQAFKRDPLAGAL